MRKLTGRIIAYWGMVLVVAACNAPVGPARVRTNPLQLQPTSTVPTATPAGAVAIAFEPSAPADALVLVAMVGSAPADLRAAPGTGATLGSLSPGTQVSLVGPIEQVQAQTWKGVRDPLGNLGWIAADAIVPLSALAITRPTLPVTPAPESPVVTTVELSGKVDRLAFPVGDALMIRIGIANRGNVPIQGVRIDSQGPWAAYSETKVAPEGSLVRGEPGTYIIRSQISIRPGETGWVSVTAFAREPGNHTFVFIPFQLDGGKLVSADGESQAIGGTVSVSR
jgi:hypothetical protein